MAIEVEKYLLKHLLAKQCEDKESHESVDVSDINKYIWNLKEEVCKYNTIVYKNFSYRTKGKCVMDVRFFFQNKENSDPQEFERKKMLFDFWLRIAEKSSEDSGIFANEEGIDKYEVNIVGDVENKVYERELGQFEERICGYINGSNSKKA